MAASRESGTSERGGRGVALTSTGLQPPADPIAGARGDEKLRRRLASTSRLRTPRAGRISLEVNINVLPAGPIQTNAYLLSAPDRQEAVLIDAPGGIWEQIEPLLAKEKCTLRELWLTHGHWDHTQGGAEVVAATRARVRAHRDDRILIETPEVMEMFLLPGVRLGPMKIDEFVEQGQRWTALGESVEVRHVPGHCPGNVAFFFAALKAVFVGDALFHGSIGRTDLPGGNYQMLERSIRDQLYSLPDDTVVYPGHGPETLIGVERETNPYVHG